MIWNSDGYKQHYQALVYFGRWGREILRNIFVRHTFEIPLWDFAIGYGSDILTTLHYYVIGDPLNLLSIAVPSAYTEYLYGILIVIRLYLAGISFSLYCFEIKKNRQAALAGTLNYVFCSFLICAAYTHPFFINPMIYLPLLLIGAERIFHKKKTVLFTVMVFVSAISNFYFFYTLAFAVCFYVVIRFFTLSETHTLQSFQYGSLFQSGRIMYPLRASQNNALLRSDRIRCRYREFLAVIFKFAAYACVGICMAAFLLLPVILQFLGTSRMDADTSFSLFYPLEFYKSFYTHFMLPGKWGQWMCLGFTAPAFLAVLVLFGKRKQYKFLKISFLILTGMHCLPFFGKALNGFSYAANRFSYIYAALVSYILVTVWEDMLTLKNTSSLFILTAGAAYYILFLWTGVKAEEAVIGGLFLILLFPTALASLFPEKKLPRQMISGIFFFVMIFHICFNWYETSGNADVYSLSDHTDSDTALGKITKTAPYAVRKLTASEKTFFRFEMDAFQIKNTAVLAGVNGIQYYWSLENSCISNYLREMTLNNYKVFNYDDLDHRTFPDALACVKYFAQKNTDFLPFGYDSIDTVTLGKSDFTIYKNQYALPLGYTYDSCISYDDYRNMEPIQRQEALLQGIVLEPADSDFPVKEWPVCSPVFTSRSLRYSVSCDENVIQQPDGSFDVKADNAAIQLSFSGLKKSETCLYLQGAVMNAGKSSCNEFMLSVSSDTSHNALFHRTKEHRYTDNQTDYLVNLGYHDEAQSVITISFPHSGIYQFDDIKVICQPMEQYPKQIAALKQDTLKQEEIGTNSIKGTINLKKDKILCLSVPYSKGFHAVVDGKKAPLLKANTMYMALPLAAGSHTIKLYYRTPGLYPGIFISCMGFLLFAMLIRNKKKRRPSVH